MAHAGKPEGVAGLRDTKIQLISKEYQLQVNELDKYCFFQVLFSSTFLYSL